MKRTLATMTTVMGLGLAIFAQGCNSNSSSTPNTTNQNKTQVPPTTPPPAPTVNKENGPAWTITLKSTCADGTAAEQCVAFYGFAVDADGHFRLGPSPANRTVSGSLKDDELKTLTAALQPFLTSATSTATGQACVNVDPAADNAPTTTDTITLTKQGVSAQSVVNSDPAKFCMTAVTQDQAQALYTEIETLANTYYQLPFPDACLDAAATVTGLYDSMNLRACNADSDCAYIASDFSIIPADTEQFVAEDDCSQVAPLVVANAASVSTQQDKLNDALGAAQTACDTRMWRSDCLNQTGFLSDTGAPVCNQHLCVKNPSVHSLY